MVKTREFAADEAARRRALQMSFHSALASKSKTSELADAKKEVLAIYKKKTTNEKWQMVEAWSKDRNEWILSFSRKSGLRATAQEVAAFLGLQFESNHEILEPLLKSMKHEELDGQKKYIVHGEVVHGLSLSAPSLSGSSSSGSASVVAGTSGSTSAAAATSEQFKKGDLVQILRSKAERFQMGKDEQKLVFEITGATAEGCSLLVKSGPWIGKLFGFRVPMDCLTKA